ncbi:universal stress protein [Rhodococcus sp. NPDC047139]|uniref:universal stress protein n=1 Tax=Rhodococcus sp. NPDC047139 TaxID=3155141 RepID=UPI0034099DE1
MNWTIFAVFITAWVLIGLATGIWMARRGHDPRWTLIAVILGPLFIPVAYERVERRPRSVSSEPIAMWGSEPDGTGSLRVMVGIDGSAESDHALRIARRLFEPGGGVLELVAVVSYDDGGKDETEALHVAKQRLAAAAAAMESTPVGMTVLAGPAGESLRWFAGERGADVLVVGRRGRGMSNRILGSVAEHLSGHCPIPVLVVAPEDR